jgi:hypothetical protein
MVPVICCANAMLPAHMRNSAAKLFAVKHNFLVKLLVFILPPIMICWFVLVCIAILLANWLIGLMCRGVAGGAVSYWDDLN